MFFGLSVCVHVCLFVVNFCEQDISKTNFGPLQNLQQTLLAHLGND